MFLLQKFGAGIVKLQVVKYSLSSNSVVHAESLCDCENRVETTSKKKPTERITKKKGSFLE